MALLDPHPPTDRVLSDQQWGHIAGEVMAAVGLAPHGDEQAVRWVAVRHAEAQGEDHIHLVATLVRQDRRRAWTNYDYRKAQQACRDLEERYNLYRVAPPGKGSRRWPSSDELNKTTRLHRASTSRPTAGRSAGRSRQGPVAPRERLRRLVRAAAAMATDEADFLHELRRAGIKVKLRHSQRNPEQVTGYAVGLEGHTNPAGETIYYGGGKLAADLSLPKLRNRWTKPAADPMAYGHPTLRRHFAGRTTSADINAQDGPTRCRPAPAACRSGQAAVATRSPSLSSGPVAGPDFHRQSSRWRRNGRRGCSGKECTTPVVHPFPQTPAG